jgi:hypothetical protein
VDDLLTRYRCEPCNLDFGADFPLAAGGVRVCPQCQGPLKTEISRQAHSLAVLYLRAFAYPFRPVVLLWTVCVCVAAVFVGFVPLIGGLLAASIEIGYGLLVLRTTAHGSNDLTLDASDVGPIHQWFAPLIRYLLAAAFAFGPAGAAYVGLGMEGGAPVVYGLLLVGFAYFPAAIVVTALSDGILAGANPVPAIGLIARIPADYALTLGFLVLAGVAGAVAERSASVVEVPILGGLVLRVLGLYSLVVAARILGLFVWEKREELS